MIKDYIHIKIPSRLTTINAAGHFMHEILCPYF